MCALDVTSPPSHLPARSQGPSVTSTPPDFSPAPRNELESALRVKHHLLAKLPQQVRPPLLVNPPLQVKLPLSHDRSRSLQSSVSSPACKLCSLLSGHFW
ncbi:hypothetical protein C8Q74DRAFT_1305819 [Fomes fomentarius]|nr:hypothetical protein C8Q74DRAFT_1305819 [Fomes fomentarius]